MISIGKEVLEIACGTGYWTPFLASGAASVLATDINEEVIAIAHQKTFEQENVSFKVEDLQTHPQNPWGKTSLC